MEVENNVVKATFPPRSFGNQQQLQVTCHPFCAFVSPSAESPLNGIYTDMKLFYLYNF